MAGGTYRQGEIKARPGHYHREESENNTRQISTINGIGAGLIKSNWGPLNEAVPIELNTSVKNVFGTGNTEDLITEMFNGGISSGYFVRIGTGGKQPTIKLKNADETDVITITGKYVGDRKFTISVRESLTDENTKECTIYDGTTVFETVTFTANEEDEVDALVTAINDGMTDFIAKKEAEATGVIKEVTQSAFTDGTQPTVTTAEYSVGLSALETYDWNCMAVDTEDPDVHALVAAFLNRAYAGGYYPMACLSENAKGDKKVELEDRMTHAAAFNNKMICYVLNPAIDAAGNVYEGYRNAARIAGYIASVATTTSLTGTPITGYVGLAESLSDAQIKTALGKGCIVLTLNKKKQVVIEQGINTLITPADDEDDGWKKIRRVKVRYELIQRCMAALEDKGRNLDNDDNGRATAVSLIRGICGDMVGENKLLPGGSVYVDPNNPPSGDSAWFVIEWDDKDSLEKTYSLFRFRFAPES